MFKSDIKMMNSGRVPAVALFNRLNGLFITVNNMTEDDYKYIDETLFRWRAIQYDFVNDMIEGDLIINADGTDTDNFKVIDKTEATPVVYESALNNHAEYKITKRYPLVEQINVLGRSIQTLAESSKVKLPELEEMLDYIKLCIETNQNQKEFYRENPDVKYVSDEEHADISDRRFEGGLHEALGPRTITGGSVFKTDRQ